MCRGSSGANGQPHTQDNTMQFGGKVWGSRLGEEDDPARCAQELATALCKVE